MIFKIVQVIFKQYYIRKKNLRNIKKKKRHYGCKRYKNPSQNKKQKLIEYRKNIIKWEKMPYYNYKKLLL